MKGLEPVKRQLMNTMNKHERFTVIWNMMNLRQFSKMLRPHLMAAKIH